MNVVEMETCFLFQKLKQIPRLVAKVSSPARPDFQKQHRGAVAPEDRPGAFHYQEFRTLNIALDKGDVRDRMLA
jgi:hypothetical protein